jgi:hypothetical protein
VKKLLSIFVIVFIFLGVISKQGQSDSSFTLVNGMVILKDPQNTYDQDYLDFWKNINILFSHDEGETTFSGYGEATASAIFPDRLETSTTSGNVNGVYYPDTGIISGDFQITVSKEYKKEASAHVDGWYGAAKREYSGKFETTIKPGAKSIKINFVGPETQTVTGKPYGRDPDPGSNFTSDWGVEIEFQVSGNIPGPQAPLISPTPTGIGALEDSGAHFSDLAGQVEVNFPNPDGTYDEENWHFAKLDQYLPVDTHIKASEDSRSGAIISFSDMSTFVLKPGSEIILSSPSAKDSEIKLLVGNLWMNVKKMAKDGSMQVEMSQAVAGIKGTTFIVEETGTTSTLKVIEGTVNYTSNANGTSVLVHTGEQASADMNGMSEVTPFDVTQYKDYGTIENGKTSPIWTILCVYYIGAIILVVVLIIILASRKKQRPN